jgi:hypothetical protein
MVFELAHGRRLRKGRIGDNLPEAVPGLLQAGKDHCKHSHSSSTADPCPLSLSIRCYNSLLCSAAFRSVFTRSNVSSKCIERSRPAPKSNLQASPWPMSIRLSGNEWEAAGSRGRDFVRPTDDVTRAEFRRLGGPAGQGGGQRAATK